MKARREVTDEKLRGGFYSPDALVDCCVERVAALTRGRSALRVLEPSAGDGAFVRGIDRCSTLRARVATIDCIEFDAREAAKCANAVGTTGRVHTASAIDHLTSDGNMFDVAIGNPPFVRFQFVREADKRAIQRLADQVGVSFAGMSNLWVPVVLAALARLAPDGAFAFIVPAECFTGVSAGVLRAWLVEHARSLQVDLFPPGSFPSVVQEVVILSGRRRRSPVNAPALVEFRDHAIGRAPVATSHTIAASGHPWTRYLLHTDAFGAFEEAAALASVVALGRIAAFEVATVTGANDYFCVDARELDRFRLDEWAVPLLPRIRHAPGLRYTVADHGRATELGAKTSLLDFSATRADPNGHHGAAAYLARGVERGLPDRYKCRIRRPWYRVPNIVTGQLMLSKRSHRYPRVVVNEAGAVTTDTIYRGAMHRGFNDRARDLVAGFHNSLTLLAAEIEGRSFGGGVLELVPSEVARLVVPLVAGFGAELDRLDAASRSSASGDALVHETNLLLRKAGIGFDASLLDRLHAGHASLQQRRLARAIARP